MKTTRKRKTETEKAFERGIEVHVSVRADMSEFSAWRPERISAFFQGIAQVVAAADMIEKPQPAGSDNATPPGRNAKPKPGED